MDIRTLKEAEFKELLPKLTELYIDAYKPLPEYGYQKKAEAKRYLKWLYKGDPKGFFVMFEGNNPIGFISCHKDWWDSKLEKFVGEIHEFVISPSFQGKGLGRKLFEKGIEYLKEAGKDTIGLWVGEDNEKARKFYERRNFQYTGNWGKWRRMIKKYDD
ncbi:MAG: GNAT family N-acetyltransferase [Synergistetes bacterium]|nr:GNAT family N-acetyltransferase [Synergistota bacterium]